MDPVFSVPTDQNPACLASPWLNCGGSVLGDSVSHLCIRSLPHPPHQSWHQTNLHFRLLCFSIMSWFASAFSQLLLPWGDAEWAEMGLLSTEIGKTKADTEEVLMDPQKEER